MPISLIWNFSQIHKKSLKNNPTEFILSYIVLYYISEIYFLQKHLLLSFIISMLTLHPVLYDGSALYFSLAY